MTILLIVVLKKLSAKQHVDQAIQVNNTFRKFIPQQFFEHHVNYGSELFGSGKADNLAILFCDIRGFTGLSEQMAPQELMNFLNGYFKRMNGPIHQNGGFIDKFIGDATMAIFDHPGGSNSDKALDAISAALALRCAIDAYNEHRITRNFSPIVIGIGIHFGPVVIGAIGCEHRMETTVIGDSVNIAYRLEALAPIYNTDIVVSGQTLDVAEASKYFGYRLLDWVRVKGRATPIEIYELIDHQAKSVQQIKFANAHLIRQGLKCRIKQQWPKALDYFQQALAINPEDTLVLHHIGQCEILQTQTLAKNWDGALVLG
jgi:adenylate cyclase